MFVRGRTPVQSHSSIDITNLNIMYFFQRTNAGEDGPPTEEDDGFAAFIRVCWRFHFRPTHSADLLHGTNLI